MIKVVVKKNESVSKITIKGHSMYAESGYDIVCASVSSIATTTVNACLRINRDSIVYQSSDGFLDIEVKEKDKIISILLENMVNLLEELSKNYPKNIKLTFN